MNIEGNPALLTEFRCNLFEDLTIHVDDVFRRLDWPG